MIIRRDLQFIDRVKLKINYDSGVNDLSPCLYLPVTFNYCTH